MMPWHHLAGPSPLESNWKWSPERPDEDDDDDDNEEEDDDSDDDEKLSSERPYEEHLPFSICYPVDVT